MTGPNARGKLAGLQARCEAKNATGVRQGLQCWRRGTTAAAVHDRIAQLCWAHHAMLVTNGTIDLVDPSGKR